MPLTRRKFFLTLVGILSLQCGFLKAQTFLTIDFEDTSNLSLLHIDTSITGNLWQIGAPQKIFLNGGNNFSARAIVTDTVNNYPVNNYSAFTLVVPKIFMGDDYINSILNCGCDFTGFSFYHKYQTDSFGDGGTVEVSYNNGNTWKNLFTDTSFAFGPHTGFNLDTVTTINSLGYSGISSSNDDDWVSYGTLWDWASHHSIIPPDSILLKFSFVSDSIETNNEGWAIDHIVYYTGWYVGTGNELLLEQLYMIFPNPSTTFLKIKSNAGRKFSCKIYDTNGNEVFTSLEILEKELTIDMCFLSTGVYNVVIKDDENNFSKKLINIK